MDGGPYGGLTFGAAALNAALVEATGARCDRNFRELAARLDVLASRADVDGLAALAAQARAMVAVSGKRGSGRNDRTWSSAPSRCSHFLNLTSGTNWRVSDYEGTLTFWS